MSTEFIVIVFLAGLTIGQWLTVWGLFKMLAKVVQSLQE